MNVTIPDSLKGFVKQQVGAGRYPDPDAFVADLIRTEAEMFERVSRGEPLPADEHFERRLGSLLDETETAGAYVEATKEEFDAMEREGLDLARERRP